MYILLLITVFKIAAVIVMIALGAIHTNRYTYWNYLFQTGFYILLSWTYWKHDEYIFKILTIFIFPIIFGSVWFVLIYITVVLQLDQGWLFLSATTIAGGSLSVGTVHTFDLLIHCGPVVDFMFVLVFDYYIDANHCFRTFRASVPNFNHFLGLMYYYLAPLIPLCIYAFFFNPLTQYPDDSPGTAMGLGFGLYLLIMSILYMAMNNNRLGTFTKAIRKTESSQNFFSSAQANVL
jgi:hypothetical protein